MSIPEGAESAPDACVEPTEPGADDSFDIHTELVEAFGKPKTTYLGDTDHKTNAADMPRPMESDGDVVDAHAPPFLRRNQICIADRSCFVTRDSQGEITTKYSPDVVARGADGKYRASLSGPEAAKSRRLTVVVQPIRRECSHYVRQLTPPTPSQLIAQTVKLGWLRRYCAARRTVAGAFLEITDSHMSACSLRDPFDAENAARLDSFDDQLEHRSENREYTDMFKLASKEFLGGAAMPPAPLPAPIPDTKENPP